jgi:hypothetical protein
MKFIAHRANLHGPNKKKENSVEYILEAIRSGFEVEMDVWLINGKWILGHDGPEHPVEFSFIEQNAEHLWCHAKNVEALHALLGKTKENPNGKLKCFWHEEDQYTITSNGTVNVTFIVEL